MERSRCRARPGSRSTGDGTSSGRGCAAPYRSWSTAVGHSTSFATDWKNVERLLRGCANDGHVAHACLGGVGVTDEQLALMQRESANLDREFRLIEESYGLDHLDLVLARGYLVRLIANERIARYLRQHHREILSEFLQI